MSKPTCFIDVDLTIIDLDHNLLPGVKHQLDRLWVKYTLVCWSAGGAEYAEEILKKHNLAGYFKAIVSKPLIMIDDDPASVTRNTRIVKIEKKHDWNTIWDQIFAKDTVQYDD